jgi:hypothetical protein
LNSLSGIRILSVISSMAAAMNSHSLSLSKFMKRFIPIGDYMISHRRVDAASVILSSRHLVIFPSLP